MRNISRVLRLWCLVLIMVLLAAGCKARPPVTVKKEIGVTLRRPEIMLVVATERNRYEQIYTSQIWDIAVVEDGTTFQEYLLEQIKQFMVDLKRIGAMAQEYGITLDNGEMEQLRRLAQDYYSQLTEADKAYTGAGSDDVLNLYQEYYLACKTVDVLTKNADLEISDNEAKVVEVSQIVLDNEFNAREVWQAVRSEGADFDAIARANSTEEQIRREIVRGELSAGMEEAVFAMNQGEISEIMEDNGRFYLFYCHNPYDQEATLARKEEMMLLRKDSVFHEYYDAFLEDNLVTVSGRVWQDVSFVTQENTTTTNLFELYQEYFPD
ncbi:MAG: peptidylprolyl isomerase [Lachnospiraceae bacterium]|nr:peptidylprolyl isomerase [Lachnospiraceae bacterium]